MALQAVHDRFFDVQSLDSDVPMIELGAEVGPVSMSNEIIESIEAINRAGGADVQRTVGRAPVSPAAHALESGKLRRETRLAATKSLH